MKSQLILVQITLHYKLTIHPFFSANAKDKDALNLDLQVMTTFS